MTALYAFDGASMFDLKVAKAHGAIAASVYIIGTPGGLPHATKTRVDEILATGLGAYANWERAADFFGTCTMAQANGAGIEAAAGAQACGFEPNAGYGIGFSFDFDVPAARFGEMGAKIKAVELGLAGRYHFDLYGQQALIDWLVANRYIDGKHWLMMSTFGQPYNPHDVNVAMVQGHDINGNWIQQSQAIPGTDVNTITDPYALKAKWPAGSPYTQGADMPLTDADVKKIWDYALTHAGADGKPDSAAHPAGAWLTGANMTGNDIRTAVSKIAGVSLTDAQVAQLGAAFAAHMPSYTLTPKAG